MEANATSTTPGLENIKKVVVVMFENRSFDHIFGALPGVNGLMLNGQLNQDYYNLPNPLEPPSPSNLPVYPVPVDPSLPMAHDLTHDFGDGMMPDLFGPIFTVTPAGATPTTPYAIYKSGYVKGVPTNQVSPGPTTYPATNSGFYTTYNSNTQQGQTALTYFEDGALKVLPKLAKSFVLCDNWYCDMPGHTLPNRGFFHCATTGDVLIDDKDNGIDESPTIFDRLNQLPDGENLWKMYTPITKVGNTAYPGQLDTRFLNGNVQQYRGVPITEFATDCENGTLPFYSFIMCWLPQSTHWTDSSMHPQSLLQPGENFLAAIYNALRKSRSWENTLLVVTFDENGGIYDHVMPPRTTPPLADKPTIQQTDGSSCRNNWTLQSQFDFSLLGPRIPALLISPWLKPGIDSQQYQNTSVVRFLIDKFNSEFDQRAQPLTERDKDAPKLQSAFNRFGTDTQRQDCPEWIEPYAHLPSIDPNTNSDAIPYSDGTLTEWTPPSSTLEAAPVAYIQELLDMYVAPLPGHPDSGKEITRTFATNAEVASYTEERVHAADQFYASGPTRIG
jgi:phospholipase C